MPYAHYLCQWTPPPVAHHTQGSMAWGSSLPWTLDALIIHTGSIQGPSTYTSPLGICSEAIVNLISTTLHCLPLVAQSDTWKKSKGLLRQLIRILQRVQGTKAGHRSGFLQEAPDSDLLMCLLMHTSLGISMCNLVFGPSHKLQLPSWASVMTTNIYWELTANQMLC